MKTDQEPAIIALMKDVAEGQEEGRTMIEEAPKQSKGSNGIAERAVQEMEGQMRAILLALEERIGETLSPVEPIAQFIPEFGAYLYNRLVVGKDGKTAMERAKGKKATVIGLEFGEKLLWKLPSKDKMCKFQQRWEYAIFVGVRRKSGEFWVVEKDGQVK